MAHEIDEAAMGFQDTGGDFKQGAFAGTIGADDTDNPTRRDLEGDILQAPIALGVIVVDIFQGEQIIGHRTPPDESGGPGGRRFERVGGRV